ncbi:hypothetical protein AGMMS50239_40460 [Bacteroidia bacterium]|nr:hypothetical protein AGMMS50239_40460 [Bacteroidia bacterium]
MLEVNDKELENFDFQDENIYKMMDINGFDTAEKDIRQDTDTIENLKIQYRSIKEIGQLFSELSYSKLLQHDREENRKETKPLPAEFQKIISSNVTFIDIPLRDDSIYKINTLNGSSYQTYCAILVAEIIKYFSELEDKNKKWKIGLIAPYKAQATLLKKLVDDYGISENITIYAATAHGFQGDECDIVFFVCNPNDYKYTGYEKCLLSKEYIYNVAISRAKDYLIILHPFSTIGNNNFINQIAKSHKNNFADKFSIIESSEIEKIIFGTENYIYKYSNSTGHDSVNVFGTSDDIKYYIKVSDNAIDIQIKNNL